MQYIYGKTELCCRRRPSGLPALLKNPAEYQVVVTNAKTGKPEYFGKEMVGRMIIV